MRSEAKTIQKLGTSGRELSVSNKKLPALKNKLEERSPQVKSSKSFIDYSQKQVATHSHAIKKQISNDHDKFK